MLKYIKNLRKIKIKNLQSPPFLIFQQHLIEYTKKQSAEEKKYIYKKMKEIIEFSKKKAALCCAYKIIGKCNIQTRLKKIDEIKFFYSKIRECHFKVKCIRNSILDFLKDSKFLDYQNESKKIDNEFLENAYLIQKKILKHLINNPDYISDEIFGFVKENKYLIKNSVFGFLENTRMPKYSGFKNNNSFIFKHLELIYLSEIDFDFQFLQELICGKSKIIACKASEILNSKCPGVLFSKKSFKITSGINFVKFGHIFLKEEISKMILKKEIDSINNLIADYSTCDVEKVFLADLSGINSLTSKVDSISQGIFELEDLQFVFDSLFTASKECCDCPEY